MLMLLQSQEEFILLLVIEDQAGITNSLATALNETDLALPYEKNAG